MLVSSTNIKKYRAIKTTCLLFFSSFFEKKGLSDCCISGKGKKEHIIMQQNYNEKSIQHQFDAYCKKVLRNELKLFENETLE